MQVLADAPNAESMRQVLGETVAARVFPGAWLHCESGGKTIARLSCGHTDYDNAIAVNDETIYDLASLSKLWTMAAWLLIADENKISVERCIGDFLPAFRSVDKRAITIRHLLQHTSGIHLPIQLFASHTHLQVLADVPNVGWSGNNSGIIARHEWTRLLAAAPLRSAPGEQVLYSCSNYFLLARVLSRIIGGNLAHFIVERLIWPLYAPEIWRSRTTFWPCKYLQPAQHRQIAPTEIIEGHTLRGEIHDEAARAFFAREGHSFCGNAGIFSDGDGVVRFARLWLHEGAHENRQILPPALVARSLEDGVVETQTSDVLTKRAWCWQIDAPLYMSAFAPKGSAGHAGFTGPTLWLHRPSQTLCVLLNNRVHPTRNGPNRFPFHRRIAQLLTSSL